MVYLSSDSIDSQGDQARRLRRAEKHVSGMWFPTNPEVVKRVREALREGRYDLDAALIIDDLMDDSALLTWLVRELSTFPNLGEIGSVRELFTKAGAQSLRALLLDESKLRSAHSFDSISDTQSARLLETIVSTSAFEQIEGISGSKSEDGLIASHLRQLGLNLIAWNYPTVYKKAFREAEEGRDIDEAISEALGFSPSLLAHAIVSRWRLKPAISAAVCPEAAREYGDAPAIIEEASAVVRLCEIGETLASLQARPHAPNAASKWEEISEKVEMHLGKEGLSRIEAQAGKRLSTLAAAHPTIFPQSISLDIPKREREKRGVEIKAQAIRVDPSDLGLVAVIEELTQHLVEGEGLRDLVTIFIKRVFPCSGFSGGVIYTLEPDPMILVGRLKCGEVRKYDAAVSVGGEREGEIVATAFRCRSPIFSSGADESLLSGAISLGEKRKVGVLYVEVQGGAWALRSEMLTRRLALLGKILSQVLENAK